MKYGLLNAGLEKLINDKIKRLATNESKNLHKSLHKAFPNVELHYICDKLCENGVHNYEFCSEYTKERPSEENLQYCDGKFEGHYWSNYWMCSCCKERKKAIEK